jgi:hypothetical protein
MVYTCCILFTKYSILLFYDRVFKTAIFHVAVWAMIIFIALWWVSAMLVLIFPCTPIRFFWDKSIFTGRCINYEAFGTAEAAITIATDVIILTMPMPLVWRLRVERRQKVILSGIFLLGGLYVSRSDEMGILMDLLTHQIVSASPVPFECPRYTTSSH